MKQISFVAGTLAIAAAVIPVSAWSADGCPPGTANTTASGGGAFSTLFDEFVADAGTRTSCAVSVATGGTNNGEEIRVYSADYRGVMTLGESDAGTLTTQQGDRIDPRRFGGPYDGDLDARTYVGTDQAGNISSTITLDLSAASDPLAFAALDTADYAFLAGTTRKEISRSLRVLADERTASTLALQSLGDLLTGAFERQDATTSIDVLGTLGSPMIGARGRYSWDSGLSIIGGAAYFNQSAGDMTSTGMLFAGAVRYLPQTQDTIRPYAEVGGRVASQDVNWRRHYNAGDTLINADVATDALSTGLYLKGGAVVEPNPDNQVLITAAYGRDWNSTNAAREAFGPDNLFAASYPISKSHTDTLSAGAVCTGHISPSIDVSVNGGAGYAIAGSGVKADVDFAGDLVGDGSNTAFVTYGASLKYKSSSQLAIQAFVQGVSSKQNAVAPAFGGSLELRF